MVRGEEAAVAGDGEDGLGGAGGGAEGGGEGEAHGAEGAGVDELVGGGEAGGEEGEGRVLAGVEGDGADPGAEGGFDDAVGVEVGLVGLAALGPPGSRLGRLLEEGSEEWCGVALEVQVGGAVEVEGDGDDLGVGFLGEGALGEAGAEGEDDVRLPQDVVGPAAEADDAVVARVVLGDDAAAAHGLDDGGVQAFGEAFEVFGGAGAVAAAADEEGDLPALEAASDLLDLPVGGLRWAGLAEVGFELVGGLGSGEDGGLGAGEGARGLSGVAGYGEPGPVGLEAG